MLVFRGKAFNEMTNEQDKFDLITVDLIKKSGKGLGMNKCQLIDFFYKSTDFSFSLGFSIIGRRHGYGVFISHIVNRIVFMEKLNT